MQSIFNLKGYVWQDPLDKAPGFMKYFFLILVNFLLSLALLYGVTQYKIVAFNGFTLFGHHFGPGATMFLEVLTNCFLFSPLIIALRKCSSFIPYLIVFLPYFLLDLYIESHFRGAGQNHGRALWNYVDGSFVSGIEPPILKFFITLSFDALVFGIFGLFLARLAAMIFYRNKPYEPAPTREEYASLFNTDWSGEPVARPNRDVFFYLFRILGFGYLIYLGILILGLTGDGAWPPQVSPLIHMTYLNDALAINTYYKITLMIILAFMAAYNKSLRFYASVALLVGHAVSTCYSLFFHFTKMFPVYDPTNFLMTSAILDGSLILFFVWAIIKYNKDANIFSPEKDFPANFSTPLTILEWMYKILFVGFLLVVVGIVCIRIMTTGTGGIGAIYGSPDPMIGNTVTLYSTLAVICFLLIKRERLRQHFFNALTAPLIFGAITAFFWVTVDGFLHNGIWITIHADDTIPKVEVDWYFILYAALNAGIAGALIYFRTLYYKVDYSINTVSPSAAVDAIALTGAFFGGDDKQHAAVLRSIDQYAGGIHGRKRGLLNLPFGLFENVLNLIYGMRPSFSTMVRDEQMFYLHKYFLRNENARKAAFIPPLAEFAFQIGLTLNSIISFANYSYINVRDRMGYVPPDARDRLQGDFASGTPPFTKTSPLPKDAMDPNNFKPYNTNPSLKQVAPRVTTPVKEAVVPDEVDFLIIGSGAGGATAAYRLACAVEKKGQDPSKILVVESGNRYQPLQDFQDSEIEMMKKIYKEGGLQQTKKYGMTVLQGECLGGSTIVNNAVCFKIPDNVRADWETNFGLDLSDLNAAYTEVQNEIHITALGATGINTRVKQKFDTAVNAYNADPAIIAANEQLQLDDHILVNHLETMGDGNWNLGNKRMRKRSMLETYIPWSESRGVLFSSNMTAVRFVCSGGNKRFADQVILRADNGSLQKVTVKKAIIVSAGAIASSHFLMRSDIKNQHVGKRLSCNFAFPVAFNFADEIKAYDGDQITLAALDPKSRSAFETYFNPPAAFSLSSVPFFFGRRDSWMNRYSNLLNFGSLIGSEPNGTVLAKAGVLSGQSFEWSLGNKDRANIRYAMKTLLQLGKAAGSTRAIIPTNPGIELSLEKPGEIESFSSKFDAFPLRMTDIFLGTAHPQGGNMIAGVQSPFSNQRVVTENFKVDGYDNVFVADASLFPTSITINPQWTIMAMSTMAANKVIDEFV
jgi:choline dehydrogenase-like flavoprotein